MTKKVNFSTRSQLIRGSLRYLIIFHSSQCSKGHMTICIGRLVHFVVSMFHKEIMTTTILVEEKILVLNKTAHCQLILLFMVSFVS